MKVNEFIDKHKIKPALAAGFKSHLHAEGETELEESVLEEEYFKFSGKKIVKVQVVGDPNSNPGSEGNSNPDPNLKTGDDENTNLNDLSDPNANNSEVTTSKRRK